MRRSGRRYAVGPGAVTRPGGVKAPRHRRRRRTPTNGGGRRLRPRLRPYTRGGMYPILRITSGVNWRRDVSVTARRHDVPLGRRQRIEWRCRMGRCEYRLVGNVVTRHARYSASTARRIRSRTGPRAPGHPPGRVRLISPEAGRSGARGGAVRWAVRWAVPWAVRWADDQAPLHVRTGPLRQFSQGGPRARAGQTNTVSGGVGAPCALRVAGLLLPCRWSCWSVVSPSSSLTFPPRPGPRAAVS